MARKFRLFPAAGRLRGVTAEVDPCLGITPVPGCFQATGSLGWAGQSSAQPRPGCLARSRPAGVERALRLYRESFPGLDCLPGGGREEWMEVASRGARHPVYPALNSSSRPAAGYWAGEGDERLLAPLPASCHPPCPEMMPNTHLAHSWGGHG